MMNILQQANGFIEHFAFWASTQPEILAVALVGSHARNAAREDSDVDLVIISDDPQKYLAHTEWAVEFGNVVKQQIEDYGKLTSLRVWYESGLEVEYGFTTRAWAQIPLDKGSRRVIEDGMRVLFERVTLLSPHETHRT
jgi:predicted nucleotidyltransferase